MSSRPYDLVAVQLDANAAGHKGTTKSGNHARQTEYTKLVRWTPRNGWAHIIENFNYAKYKDSAFGLWTRRV